MKLITRDSDYALRAICFIAKYKKDKVSVSKLVKELNVPRPFLRKILQELNKKGILKYSKGNSGGFLLAKDTKAIKLTDIMHIFQGKLSLNECFLKKVVCPHTKTCPLRKRINRIEGYVSKELNSVTIASLINQG